MSDLGHPSIPPDDQKGCGAGLACLGMAIIVVLAVFGLVVATILVLMRD